MALTYTPAPVIGSPCPDFKLLAVDGNEYSLEDYKYSSAFLVMFICNHCPYVKGIEDRLISLAQNISRVGVRVVAICSNDAENYPEDSFENLKKRWVEKKYPFQYLYDETQVVAKRFGAVCTPDFFLYDRDMKLYYRGRLDDSWQDPTKVTQQDLRTAIEMCLKGEKAPEKQISSMGCSIKWK